MSALIVVLAVVAAYALVEYVDARRKTPNVPAMGPSGNITSFFGVVNYLKNARQVMQEGYAKYKVFKVPEPRRWMVLVTLPEMIEEVRLAKDDELNFQAAVNHSMSTDYTLKPGAGPGYHLDLVKSHLTRNLPALFDVVNDEIIQAFSDLLQFGNQEWIKFPALPTMQQIVCRVSNRIFVGTPLCRDLEWMELNIRFTKELVIGAAYLNFVPRFLKPFAALFYTNVRRSLKQGTRLVEPLVNERWKMLNEHGQDWEYKPNDFLAWLMDNAKGEERQTTDLALRLLILNFAAIHTSSNSFTHALYHLAAQPEYIAPLREEVEEVVAGNGWSKASLAKMRKVDSFLRESQRMNSLGSTVMVRKVMKPFTFKDGTRLPAGSFVAVPQYAIHNNSTIYDNPEIFDGFRFANMRDADGESGTKYQMVATSPNYLPFGHGRHACPGRFFAAQELKLMLAHLVVTYDVKLEQEGVRPPNQYFGPACLPNSKAEVMIRKR